MKQLHVYTPNKTPTTRHFFCGGVEGHTGNEGLYYKFKDVTDY